MECKNIDLGRKGEIFILGKLFKLGWHLPEDLDKMNKGVDWVLEKGNNLISIQMKVISKTNKRQSTRFSNYECDFAIITDLNDCFILPKIFLNKYNGSGVRLTNKIRKTSNKFELLELDKVDMFGYLNDLRMIP